MTVAIGRFGTWCNFDRLPAGEVLAFVGRAEALGYDALWVGEAVGREAFGTLGHLAGVTSRIRLGVGIASIYARDAVSSHAAAATLHELSGGRFVMGLGVSHEPTVTGLRGHAYLPPVRAMREYLDAYGRAVYRGPTPYGEPPLVVAALRRRMLELAATRSDGAFPYLVPLTYVEAARAVVDAAARSAGRSRPLLVVTQAVRLETGPERAHEAARGYLRPYLGTPSYQRNLAECGFTDEEIAAPGADRLADAIVAWGDEATVRGRLRAMHAAGADHVAMIPLRADGTMGDLATLEALAPPW